MGYLSDGAPPDDMVDAANNFLKLLDILQDRVYYHKRRAEEHRLAGHNPYEGYKHMGIAEELERIMTEFNTNQG